MTLDGAWGIQYLDAQPSGADSLQACHGDPANSAQYLIVHSQLAKNSKKYHNIREIHRWCSSSLNWREWTRSSYSSKGPRPWGFTSPLISNTSQRERTSTAVYHFWLWLAVSRPTLSGAVLAILLLSKGFSVQSKACTLSISSVHICRRMPGRYVCATDELVPTAWIAC